MINYENRSEIRVAGPTFAAVLLALMLMGCASSGGQDAGSEQVRRVPVHANRTYLQARETWARLHASPLDRAAHEQGLHRVIAKLRDASVLEPNNPLLHSKAGDLYLDVGDVRSAIDCYAHAVELCADWAPSWVGLARCAALENRPREAEQALTAVTWALESLREWGVPEPPGFFESFLSAFGIEIPREPERRAIGDPSLEPDDARSLVYAWMTEGLAWSPANGALLGGTPETTNGDIEKRMIARAELVRALMVAEAADPPGGPKDLAVIKAVEPALDRDRDFFDARLMKAYAHLRLGEPDVARALLEPYLGDTNPMLANHDLLLELMCKAYTGVYLRRPDLASRTQAAALLFWIREVHGPLENGFWRLVQDWFIARAADEYDALEGIAAKLVAGTWVDYEIEVVRRGLVEDLERARRDRNAVVPVATNGRDGR